MHLRCQVFLRHRPHGRTGMPALGMKTMCSASTMKTKKMPMRASTLDPNRSAGRVCRDTIRIADALALHSRHDRSRQGVGGFNPVGLAGPGQRKAPLDQKRAPFERCERNCSP